MLAVGAMTLVAPTIASMLCTHMTLIFQVEQGPVVMVAAQDDTAAIATVAAIRTTVGLVLHVTKVHGTFAAFTRAAIYLHIVYKIRFCHCLSA